MKKVRVSRRFELSGFNCIPVFYVNIEALIEMLKNRKNSEVDQLFHNNETDKSVNMCKCKYRTKGLQTEVDPEKSERGGQNFFSATTKPCPIPTSQLLLHNIV